MYLRIPNAVTIEARPSWISVGMQEMFGCFEVNGDATEASVSERDTPACAVFQAVVRITLE